jgi:hypothetical protein
VEAAAQELLVKLVAMAQPLKLVAMEAQVLHQL